LNNNKEAGGTMNNLLIETYGPFMTVKDLSEVLNLSTQTIYNKSSGGELEIPHYKLGRKLLFPTPAVADYIHLKLA
jgi:excisionase family DNA binding protein